MINLDFPETMIDYLHRMGRTGRMGAHGKVTSIVTKHNVRLMNQIQGTSLSLMLRSIRLLSSVFSTCVLCVSCRCREEEGSDGLITRSLAAVLWG